MDRLKSALTAISMAAGVAVVITVFVVSAGALPGHNNPKVKSPSSVQYNREATTPKHSETGPGPGYYNFYDRWTARKNANLGAAQAREDASAAVPPRGKVSEGSEPAVKAPAQAREIMEPPTPYSQVVD